MPNAVRHIAKFGFGGAALPHNGSLALGGGAASPLDMAQGYAVLANGGRAVKPYVIDAIYGPDGEALYRAEPAVACEECAPDDDPEPLFEDEIVDEMTLEEMAEIAPDYRPDATADPELFADVNLAPQAVSRQNVFLIQDMMRDVVKRGTGRRAMALGRQDLSGKTGTSNGQLDAWFSGYNDHLVASVWVGFDIHDPLGAQEQGGRAALPIWIEFMRVALDGVPDVPPVMPDGLAQARIDPDTGLLVPPDRADAIMEIFQADHLPPMMDSTSGDKEDATSEEDPYEIY